MQTLYLLELKEVELGKLQIVKEQIVTVVFINLPPAITLLNTANNYIHIIIIFI